MANFCYTRAKRDLMKGDIDFDEAGDDIRARIVMTNTTCDTEEDTTFMDQFTTLDTHDGTNYVDKALGTQAVNEDTANDRAEFDAVDVTWTALGAGTRAVAGIVIYKFVTDDTASVPLFWIDTPALPNSNGGDWTAQWNAQGIGQAT